MSITLSPEVEAKLVEEADRKGLSLDETAEGYILSGLEWQVTDDEILAIRQGLKDIEEGRVKPFDEVVRNLRAKYAHLRTTLADENEPTSIGNGSD